MADTITYPDGGYGILPADSFNKYIRFQNQRRATTGSGASAADRQAFWSGMMDSVVKNSAARASQNLENRRLDATIEYQNRQLDANKDARKGSMIAGLAQYPMTYLMYDALGIGKGKDHVSKVSQWGDSISGGMRKLNQKLNPWAQEEGIPNYSSPGDIDMYSTRMNIADGITPRGSEFASPGDIDMYSGMSNGFDFSPIASGIDWVGAAGASMDLSDMVNIDNSADLASGMFDWSDMTNWWDS